MRNICTVYPNICASAMKQKHHGAYALTSLVKVLNIKDKNGNVGTRILGVAQKMLGWSDSKFYRAYRDAQHMGWMNEHDGRIFIAGPKRIAESLECLSVGRHSVKIDPECFYTDKGIKQAFLKAFLHDKTDRPLSQAYIRKSTGIPERTQRHYLNRSKDVYRISNYILTTINPSDVISARVSGYAGAFVKDGSVIIQGPNSYQFNESGSVSFGSRRSAQRANAQLRAPVISATGKTCELRQAPLYYQTEEAFYKDQKLAYKGKLVRRSSCNILSREMWRNKAGVPRIRLYEPQIDPILSWFAG